MVLDPPPDSFRYEVLAIIRQLYPGVFPSWRLGSDTAEVIWGDRPIYLGNLYAHVRLFADTEREKVIRDWLRPFDPAAQARFEAAEKATDDWSAARPLLRPRLQSRVVTNDNKTMVRQPFSPDLAITYTLDLGDRDAYVLDERFAGWSVTIEEVHANAIANLESMSADISLAPERHESMVGSYLLIETGDGYDASRILLPGFRTRLLAAMGPSLCAGVPARGLLYIWSSDSSLRHQIEDMVREDVMQLPHPLSKEIFAFDAAGLRLADQDAR